MSRLTERLRQVNSTRKPEDSVALRTAVLAAVMTGAGAIASVGGVSAGTGLLVLASLPFAYWFSYKRRAADNWHVKILLAVAALIALARFLGQLRGIITLDEVRYPLADVFLWVQVLHSFDLPARKDLNFSLGSSLALMAVAGSLSQDLRLMAFLVVYAVAVVSALWLSHRSEIAEGTVATVSGSPRAARRGALSSIGRGPARGLAAAALAGAVLFLVLPQPRGLRTFALPFNIGVGGGLLAGAGAIANPGFSDNPGSRSSGIGYYGFGTSLDLRVRGELSDELVMRVRSTAPAMWRGVVFDHYDGTTWSAPETEPVPLRSVSSGLYIYPVEFRSLGPRASLSSTFYIETPQPSVVFTGGQPERIFFYDEVNVDEVGALRVDQSLSVDDVYSIVSSRGAASPDELRAAGDYDTLAPEMDRYFQLPETVTQRTRDLAEQITRNEDTIYDKVKAIERYLEENFLYSTDSPIPPIGQDAVDHFLFETDVGFCEQFASATVIMLRSLGIPARVVAGYATGSRNAFTGYYEIKNSDSHAWVEVFFPHLGWYEFDPTYDIPAAELDLAEVIPLVRLIEFIVTKIAALIPSGGLRILVAAFSIGLAGWAFLVLRSRIRRRPAPAPAQARAAPKGPVGRALRNLENVLEGRGLGRAPAETARELMARAPGAGRSDHALAAFEKERYAPDPPTGAEVTSAVKELQRLAEIASNGNGAKTKK